MDLFLYILPSRGHPFALIIRIVPSVASAFEAFNVVTLIILLCVTFTRMVSQLVSEICKISNWKQLISSYRTLHLTMQIISHFSSMLIIGTMLLGLVVGVMLNFVSIKLAKYIPTMLYPFFPFTSAFVHSK